MTSHYRAPARYNSAVALDESDCNEWRPFNLKNTSEFRERSRFFEVASSFLSKRNAFSSGILLKFRLKNGRLMIEPAEILHRPFQRPFQPNLTEPHRTSSDLQEQFANAERVAVSESSGLSDQNPIFGRRRARVKDVSKCIIVNLFSEVQLSKRRSIRQLRTRTADRVRRPGASSNAGHCSALLGKQRVSGAGASARS